MTAARDGRDGVPAPELAPAMEGRPGPAEDTYSPSEEEEIAARLEALGYLE
jgi:hypothetical protein